MNSGKNKSDRKDAYDPALLGSYLVEVGGIHEGEDREETRRLAAEGKQVIKSALKEFHNQKNSEPLLHNFGYFLEMLRRRDRLSREDLASKADIDLDEIVQMETNPHHEVSPRSLYQLERCFKLEENLLGRLSGAVTTIDREVQDNIVRYAAQAKHASHLNDEESRILNEVIIMLSQKG